MHIRPFATEQFFSQFEFAAKHLLSASDCETLTIEALCELAGVSLRDVGQVPLGYTESQGSPSLRAAIAARHAAVDAADVIVVTPEEGIYLTMRALLEPADHVVVLEPCYDSLRNVAEHMGCSVTPWSVRPHDAGWSLQTDDLRAAIKPHTRLIVVNFPHNPTGYQPTQSVFEEILAVARAHDCWVLCDEMYRGLEFGTADRLPSGTSLYEKCVALSGLSKAHGLPGLRIGWLLVRDPAVRDQLINWKHYTTICPPGPCETLAGVALSVENELTRRNVDRIKGNLEYAEHFFARHEAKFHWRRPQAGSVALFQKRAAQATTTEYCRTLARDHGIVLLPGECLGALGGFIRIGLGRETFKDALAAYDAHLVAS